MPSHGASAPSCAPDRRRPRPFSPGNRIAAHAVPAASPSNEEPSMPVRLAVLTALAALVLPAAAARADNPVLIATVGVNDGFNISLKDANGQNVTHLDPGTYTIQVHDLSTIHNFHLKGPGVDEATDPETTSDPTWTVTFTDGKYTFQCDPHSTVMHGSFTVGTVATPPPAT